MDNLTPKAIVAALDEHIIGQKEAKRAVAVALRNRWRRQRLDRNLRDEVTPKNILMVGPTGCGKTEMLHLRIVEHPVDGMDRPAGHAALVEDVDPFGAGLGLRVFRNLGIQRIAVFEAQLAGLVMGIGRYFVGAKRPAQALEHILPASSDIEMPVLAGIDAGGDRRRVIVAGLRRNLTADQPARGLKIQHRDLRLQQ